MARHVFRCIDGHTAGNPVRLVIEGAPALTGDSMSARRQDFMARYDWIRTGLCFEPRGHEMMSGGVLYAATTPEADVGICRVIPLSWEHEGRDADKHDGDRASIVHSSAGHHNRRRYHPSSPLHTYYLYLS